MYFFALLEDGLIVDQVPTNMSNDECIQINEMLQKAGILTENYEVAITYEPENSNA